MGTKTGIVIGFTAGYVLGSRAGRERYEQIRGWWSGVTGSPTVRRAGERTKEAAGEGARRGLEVVQQGVQKAGSAVKERLDHSSDPADQVVETLERQTGHPPTS